MIYGKPVLDTRKMAAAQQRRRSREQLLKGGGFDPKCFHLAEYFLQGDGSPSEHIGLAQQIQDAVEDWFRVRLEATEPCLSQAEQKAQGTRCGCHGADDYCVCQNVPDAATRAERKAHDLPQTRKSRRPPRKAAGGN